MIGVTGLSFFALNYFTGIFAPVAAALGTTPLMMAVIVGAAQNILSKSSKYALFDPCKEMSYIPLDRDSKTKGKAAIDVVSRPSSSEQWSNELYYFHPNRNHRLAIRWGRAEVLWYSKSWSLELEVWQPQHLWVLGRAKESRYPLTIFDSTFILPKLQYFALILMGMIYVWIKAANSLADQFDEAMKASCEWAGYYTILQVSSCKARWYLDINGGWATNLICGNPSKAHRTRSLTKLNGRHQSLYCRPVICSANLLWNVEANQAQPGWRFRR